MRPLPHVLGHALLRDARGDEMHKFKGNAIAFAIYRLMESLQQFDEEFSNWYLRRSRRRFWKSEADQDKEAAYRTLYTVLTTVVRALAPVLPFLTEEVYQNLVLNLRMQSKVKIRQPLPAVFVKPRDQHERTVLSQPDYVAQILEALTAHQAFLQAELLADRIEPADPGPHALRFKLAGEEVSISVRRA